MAREGSAARARRRGRSDASAGHATSSRESGAAAEVRATAESRRGAGTTRADVARAVSGRARRAAIRVAVAGLSAAATFAGEGALGSRRTRLLTASRFARRLAVRARRAALLAVAFRALELAVLSVLAATVSVRTGAVRVLAATGERHGRSHEQRESGKQMSHEHLLARPVCTWHAGAGERKFSDNSRARRRMAGSAPPASGPDPARAGGLRGRASLW